MPTTISGIGSKKKKSGAGYYKDGKFYPGNDARTSDPKYYDPWTPTSTMQPLLPTPWTPTSTMTPATGFHKNPQYDPPTFSDNSRGGSIGGDGTTGSVGYVPPGGTGGGTGADPNAPYTGSGSIGQYGYTPQAMSDIYNNPNMLATDLLAKMGINNPGLAQSLAQYLNPAMVAHLMNTQGDPNQSTDAASLSAVNDYMQMMVTPNGVMPDAQQLMQILFGATNIDDGGLGGFFGLAPDGKTALDARGQVDNVTDYLSQMTVGLNPYAQAMYRSAAGRVGQQYQNATSRIGMDGYEDPGSSFTDYLAKSGFGRRITG